MIVDWGDDWWILDPMEFYPYWFSTMIYVEEADELKE
jgi:hypothetical protein